MKVKSCSVVAIRLSLLLLVSGGLLSSLLRMMVTAAPTLSFSPSSTQLPGGVVEYSSPTLADLDGDGHAETILIGTTTHNGSTDAHDRPAILAAVRSDGLILWTQDLGAPINSAPAVGDIDNDGEVEVVVSLGGDVGDTQHDGGIVALDRNGNVLWHFYTQDHNQDGYADGVFSSPTLCDVDGDGTLEIIFGGWDQRIYLLDDQGHSLWNDQPAGFPGPGYYNADSIWSTAACADLNRDGVKEIIIGADITGGGILPDGTHTQDGGFLYIFSPDGTVLVRRYLPEAIYASPAIGDLDGDGQLEIVVGTSWYWWNAHGRTEQPYVYVFDASWVFDTSLSYTAPEKLPFYQGWPQPTDYPGFSSPALGDLDGDGDLEIVIGTSHPDLSNDDIPGSGSVYAWHHTGELVNGWPVHPKNSQGNDGPIFSSPTLADVDGDSLPEILFSMLWDVQIYEPNGALMTRLGTYWTVWGSPAVGDTDGDGHVEIWIGGSEHQAVGGDPSSGYLWKFEADEDQTLEKYPWPMFHRDQHHLGYYPRPPRMRVTPSELFVLHPYGSGNSETAYLFVHNAGDDALIWEVYSCPGNVALTPMSGTAYYTSSSVITVTISTGSYQTGTYSLGTVVITSTNTGTVQGSPAWIPITLYVGQVHRTYLPAISRSASTTP